jgi:hypothetical protein
VGGGDHSPVRIDEKHGQAIGGLDAQEEPRLERHRGIGNGAARPGSPLHRGTVDLPQQEQFPRGSEQGRGARGGGLAVFETRRSRPSPEAVQQSRKAGQNRGLAAKIVHGGSYQEARVTLGHGFR